VIDAVSLYEGLDARYVNVTGDLMTGDLQITDGKVLKWSDIEIQRVVAKVLGLGKGQGFRLRALDADAVNTDRSSPFLDFFAQTWDGVSVNVPVRLRGRSSIGEGSLQALIEITELFRWRMSELVTPSSIKPSYNRVQDLGEALIAMWRTAFLQHVDFDDRTTDPTLSSGLMWFRSDLGVLRYSPDGSTTRDLTYGPPPAPPEYRFTVQGGNSISINTWGNLGFMDYVGDSMVTRVRVPSGKTFELWALGQGDCAYPASSNIRVYNETTGTVVRELGLGVAFAEYTTAYTASGPCVVKLQGFQSGGTYDLVGGYMVFRID